MELGDSVGLFCFKLEEKQFYWNVIKFEVTHKRKLWSFKNTFKGSATDFESKGEEKRTSKPDKIKITYLNFCDSTFVGSKK